MSAEPAFDFFEDDRASDGFAAWPDEIGNAGSEDELFALLATQRPPTSKLARQQLRGRLITILKRKLGELESDAAAARTADAWLQEGGEPDDLQGEEFVIEETKPWASVVDGAAVLDEAEALYGAYVLMTEEKRHALALWTVFFHAFECFGVAPILELSSPTKRCGKSSTVIVSRYLCRAPLLSGNITPAALFRAIQAWKPTLLIDEADTFTTMHDELRGILNAGHTRDTAFVVRAEGDSNEPRLFSTWAPKVVAAIGRMPDTIEDRAIRIHLSRKPTTTSKRDAFDSEQVRRDCEPVRRKIARFVLDNVDAIVTATVDRPDGLDDRAWNNWRPLLMIASVAGGDWPQRAERAALALAADRDDDDQEDVGTLALQHVWEVVGPAGRLPTADVPRHLVTKEEGPWAKWWEASVAKDELKSPAARLARLLKPFGVKPASSGRQPSPVYDLWRQDELDLIVAATRRMEFPLTQKLRVLTMIESGGRAAELRGIQLGDFDLYRKTVTVLGKGRKQRRIPISVELSNTVDEHLLPEYPIIGRIPILTDHVWFPIHKMGDRLLTVKPERVLS